MYEMLAYTAELKNPMKEPFEKKRAKVEMVIQQLGLNGCRGVRIGNPLARGISGEGAESPRQGCSLTSRFPRQQLPVCCAGSLSLGCMICMRFRYCRPSLGQDGLF